MRRTLKAGLALLLMGSVHASTLEEDVLAVKRAIARNTAALFRESKGDNIIAAYRGRCFTLHKDYEKQMIRMHVYPDRWDEPASHIYESASPMNPESSTDALLDSIFECARKDRCADYLAPYR